MNAHALLSAVGGDRIGIVDDVSAAILGYACNIEESRMALLGGDFAVLILLSGTEEAVTRLTEDAKSIGEKLGLAASARRTESPDQKLDALPYILESSSLDTNGIVNSVAAVLRRYNINIADLETDTNPAPWTGAPMFNMRARLSVPRSVSIPSLRGEMQKLESEHNLDLRLYPAGRTPTES
ncbi:MAG: ACT domain-containing protein [Treponemataceae bacterium]